MVLTVGQVGVQDVRLQVGPISATVTVGTGAVLLETERTQQSDTIERGQIENLPNLSRKFTSYIFTLPGVVDVAAARVQQSRAIAIPTSGFSVGAGNGRSNYVSIDGGENDSGTGNLRIRKPQRGSRAGVPGETFAAEYGFYRRYGGQRRHARRHQYVSRSGYLFYRSQKTAARDPLNTTDEKV